MNRELVERNISEGYNKMNATTPTIGDETESSRLYGAINILRRVMGESMSLENLDDILGYYGKVPEINTPVLSFCVIASSGYYFIRQFNLGNRFAIGELHRIVEELKEIVTNNEGMGEVPVEIINELTTALENMLKFSLGSK
jgi:hypothetical protein